MKKLILTFFIIILCIIILDRKENFKGITERNSNQQNNHKNFLKKIGEFENCKSGKIRGCVIEDIANPNSDEIFNCHMQQCRTVLGQIATMTNKNYSFQVLYGRILKQQVKNYFTHLYMNNLEKFYKGSIVITPAPYRARSFTVDETYVISEPLYKFMNNGHQQSQNYSLKPNYIQSISNLTFRQFHGIYVPFGFKIGISNANNNTNGRKCSGIQPQPDSSILSACIPAHLANHNKYIKGGKYYSNGELRRIFNNSGGFTTVWRRQPDWQKPHRGDTQYGDRPDSGYLYHQSLKPSMKGNWLRDASSQYYAYGDPVFRHINVIADKQFFNEFFATKKIRDEIRKEFQSGDFSRLNKY